MIGEAGRPRSSTAFAPSAASPTTSLAPLLFHTSGFPWPVVIAAAPNWDLISGDTEIQLFRRLTPIPPEEARRATQIALAEMLPALLEMDYRRFCEAITAMSMVGFKRAEIESRGAPCKNFLDTLRGVGLDGVSMSSWGPACFGFAPDDRVAHDALELLSTKHQTIGFQTMARVASSALVRLEDSAPVPVEDWLTEVA